MTKKLTIPYFPKELRYLTPFALLVALYLFWVGFLIWGVLIILVSVIIFTTHYVTEIDLGKRQYNDFISMIGIPMSQEKSQFQNLDRIVITKGRYAQTINTRVQSRQIDWVDYTATLVVDGGRPLDLVTKVDKQELMLGLKDLAGFLQVPVEDRTTGQSYWVDMSRI